MPTVDCYCTLPSECTDSGIARFHIKTTSDGVTTSDQDYSCTHNCCSQWYCMRPPVSSSSSSSSSRSSSSNSNSSSSGSGSVTVTCCANPIPTTLYATVISSPNCACVGTTVVTMVYNSGTGNWYGSALFGSCGIRDIQLSLYCTGISFLLDMTFSDSCATTTGSVGSLTCSPFQWQGAIGNNDLVTCGCAGPTPGLEFTITG